MPAAQVQMNVRIDEARKSSGDAVLAKFGVSPSHAVRSLWDFLATHKSLPDFMTSSQAKVGDAAKSAVQLAEEGAGMAARLAEEAGLHCGSLQEMTYGELRDAAFEERLVEWEARRV